MSLSELRKRIDALDRRLVPLLNERTAIARSIGDVKRHSGAQAYVPAREREVFRRVEKLNQGPLAPAGLRAIYREIMSAALAGEDHARVACRGPAGGLAALAARSRFGASVKYKFLSSARAVADEVAAGRAACGVVWRDDLPRLWLGRPSEPLAVRIGAEIVLSPAGAKAPAQHFVVLCPRGDSAAAGEKTMLRLGDPRGRAGLLPTLVKALGPVPVLRVELAVDGRLALVEILGDPRDQTVAKALARLNRVFAEVALMGCYIGALELDSVARRAGD